MKNNNKRIFKNTILLYAKTIIVTIVALFSVRYILSALGEDDYGTYNVVAGFVSMFSFITGVMINSSQRHFSIYLANDDWNSVNRLFSVNIVIYLIYTAIILVLAETLGLWFVMNYLSFPREQSAQVFWVYQFSIVTIICTLLSSPFIALLISNEHMVVYSFVAILEAVAKISIAFLLFKFTSDRLFYYGLFIMIASLVINLTYIIYGFLRYKKLKVYFEKDRNSYKEVFSFLNWNLIGGSASALKNQGINVIMNIQFGSAINAARSIAYQTNSAVSSFSQNFMKAVDPRITKSYTEEDKTNFISYIFSASKLSFYLLMILCIPFFVNSSYVINLWLEKVPDYTIAFVVLVLVESLILSITDPLLTGVQATGQVKYYQIIGGGLALLNMPLSYLLIVLTNNPLYPFFVAIFISVLISAIRIIIFKKLLPEFPVSSYFLKVILPMVIISSAVSLVDYFFLGGASNFLQLVIYCFSSLIISLILIFVLGLSSKERLAVLKLFKRNKNVSKNTEQ